METAALHLKITSEGMDQAQKGLEGVENAATMVEDAVKKMTAAFALFKAGQFLGDLTLLAARYETLGVVMRVVGNNAGYTGAQMEQFAKGLQAQGISMVESRNTLAMMASAHIDLANASKLGRIAQDAAVIGNINSSEAFQRMIYGIQSGQVEILRTIGLNVNFEQSYKKLAQQLGKNAQDLAELEKMQARTNVVMEKGKDITGAYEESLGTVGKAAKSMERIWENLQVVMGAVFQPAFTVVINGMTDAMKTAAEWTSANATELSKMAASMRDVVSAGGEFTKLLADLAGGGKGASESVGFLTRVFQGISLIIAGATDLLRAFLGTLAGAIGEAIKYVGIVADLATRLAGFGGKGGITNFGEGLADYGRTVLNELNNGSSTGRILDGMLNGTPTGTSSAANEAARIAEAAKRKAEADAEAAKAAAAALAAAGIHTNTLGFRSMMEDEKTVRAIHEQTVKDYEVAEVATKRYGVSVAEVDRLIKQLRKDSADAWDNIADVIEHSGGRATDTLVIWMDNLDGVGRSWKTLGETVKSVLRDMMIEMQRAVIQQQMMDPLLKWVSKGISAWANPGSSAGATTPTTGGTAGGGLNLGEFAQIAPTKGQTSITVNYNAGKGGSASVVEGGQQAVDLAQMINATIDQWAVKNSRTGGMLARA